MPRARGLGIPFEGKPGKFNAITDVKGVEVGYSTINIGTPEDFQNNNSAFARTGVTAILPRGKKKSAVFAGRHDLNGNGELTGTHWIDDSGFLHGPIMITNTNSVGIVRDSTAKWMIENNCYYASYREGKEINGFGFFYPTVGETYDGILNDINGFKVKEEHVFEALNTAKSGEIQEGNVGGGTGMRCYSFKGGTGTSSRVIEIDELEATYTVGVLVQANYGRREELQVAGIPFGKEIKNCDEQINSYSPKPGEGSIIVVVATDAPVLPWQLNKLCRRVSLGIGNLGGGYQNGSGDIFIGFSTANENAFSYTASQITLLSDEQIEPLFKAVSQATEEAIVNALVAAESMVGRNGNFVPAMPHDQIKSILQNYNEYIQMRYKL
ncbi:DmpA family aminopeptidase [Anaerotignum sp.]|uniref:DmpA family aminopeptidase n=1 Tax=Anaerotignum sp. TaxID=2039241 RepID=UPI0028B01E42|nr:P1 family peptidase [Anaerotignum sp.]